MTILFQSSILYHLRCSECLLAQTQLSQKHAHYKTNCFHKATGLGQINRIYDFISCQNHHGEGEDGLASTKEHKNISNMITYLCIISFFDLSFPFLGNFNKFSPKLRSKPFYFICTITQSADPPRFLSLESFSKKKNIYQPLKIILSNSVTAEEKVLLLQAEAQNSPDKRTRKRQTEGIKHMMCISENNSDVEHWTSGK